MISKTINRVTDAEFTHASISFSDTIQPMYSFGRKVFFLNFPAGLKDEPLDKGFYKHYHHADLGIFTLEVSDEGLKKMQDFVQALFDDDRKWRFNAVGLVLAKNNIQLERDHKMFCSEFVARCLQVSGEIELGKDPSLYQPIDFTKLKGVKCIYKGKIDDAIGRHFENVEWKE